MQTDKYIVIVHTQGREGRRDAADRQIRDQQQRDIIIDLSTISLSNYDAHGYYSYSY